MKKLDIKLGKINPNGLHGTVEIFVGKESYFLSPGEKITITATDPRHQLNVKEK